MTRSNALIHFAVFTVFACFAMNGCSSSPKAPPKALTVQKLRLTHHVGGTHERTVIHQDAEGAGHWLQTFGSTLLVINPQTGVPSRTIELGKDGETGRACDMLAHGQTLWIVVEDDQVMELSLADPRSPSIVATLTRKQLGIRPRRLSLVNGQVYASGIGGIASLPDATIIFAREEDCGRVVKAGGQLVTTIGKQIVRLSDGKYLGSASDLQPLDPPVGDATIVFTRQVEVDGQPGGTLVGLMNDQCREVNSSSATVASAGIVRSVRVIDGMLWVVADDGVIGHAFKPDRLEATDRAALAGMWDVGQLDDQRMAMAGSSGRCVYALGSSDLEGDASQYTASQREPSRLSHAASDGQHIVAGSYEGTWVYLIGARAELSKKEVSQSPPPRTEAAVADGQAGISEDGLHVSITGQLTYDPKTKTMTSGTWEYAEPEIVRFHTIAAIDGDFWLGHERGITVIRPRGPEADRVIGRIRLPGAVKFLFPLLVGGGASFASEFGGFGVVRLVDEPIGVTGPAK